MKPKSGTIDKLEAYAGDVVPQDVLGYRRIVAFATRHAQEAIHNVTSACDKPGEDGSMRGTSP